MLDSFEVEALLGKLGFKQVELKTHAVGFEHPDRPGQRLYLKDGRGRFNDPRKVVRRQPLVLHPETVTLPGFADTDVARRRPNLCYVNANMSSFCLKSGGRAAGIAVDIADEVALLEVLGVVSSNWVGRTLPVAPITHQLSEDAAWLVQCFLSSDNPQLYYWWPKYRSSVARLDAAIVAGDLDLAFSIIWLDADNHVSNAGQGLLGRENAERSRMLLMQLMRDAYADGSPAQFHLTISQLTAERALGRQAKTPYLLAARMFAALHPKIYHTLVDESRQAAVLGWFEENTGFHAPSGNWAEIAQALTQHLQELDCFKGDFLLRNMFPWFVHTRLAARTDTQQTPRKAKKHTPRASEAYADLPAHRRRIVLRHNLLSAFLANQLEHARPGMVRVEEPVGSGGTFDVLVLSAQHRKQGGDLYEIKVANSAASAVRQALGQLLEYAHRHPGLQPARLYVAAEPELDVATELYLSELRTHYGLPVHYHRIEMPGPAFFVPEDELVQQLRQTHGGASATNV